MTSNVSNTKPKNREGSDSDVEQFNATAAQVLNSVNTVVGIVTHIDGVLAKLEALSDEAKQLFSGAKTQIEQAKNAAIQEIMSKVGSASIPLHLQSHQQAEAIVAGNGRSSNQTTLEITS